MILHAILQWGWLCAVRLMAIIAGFVVVMLAIPFRVNESSKSDGRPIINLPRWAWLWGNDYDGLLGDGRGWWAANTPFGVSVTSFLAMYWWAAIRNPANNMRLLEAFSAPIVGSLITFKGKAVVEDKPGMGGWQLVIVENGGKRWYGFYLVHERSRRTRNIQLGIRSIGARQRRYRRCRSARNRKWKPVPGKSRRIWRCLYLVDVKCRTALYNAVGHWEGDHGHTEADRFCRRDAEGFGARARRYLCAGRL